MHDTQANSHIAPSQDESTVRSSSQTAQPSRLTWFLIALSTLLFVRYFVPYFAEHLQYSLTKGRHRAELEAAKDGLAALPLNELSTAYQLISKRVGPSVVHINVESSLARTRDAQADRFYGYGNPESRGQGSGVIVDEAGYIVTNNHVVDGATTINVTLSDGRVVAGRVIGVDELTDIAVLKIDADGLVATEWGDSNRLEVGALVWAVGSPFGFQHSVTFGILSAKHRAGMAGTAWQDFIQTDAAVNPGNSGGPLVDANGQIVGINTAIVGESYQGISFAIPSVVARQVYNELRDGGFVERGWLGAQLINVTDEAAEVLNLSATRGAFVRAVVTDQRNPSPAQTAGLQPGDVVIKWDQHLIPDAATLTQLIAGAEIGSTAEVVVSRDRQEIVLSIQIGRRPLQLD